MTAITIASIASTIATNLLGEIKLDADKQALREATNILVAKLHKDKVIVGRLGKNPCAIAYAFHSTLLAGGVTKGTANNYLTTFKSHVASGKPIIDWNLHRKTSTTSVSKEKVQFASKLLKAYNDAEFDSFIADLQASFNNDEIKTLKEGIVSYLEMMGEDTSKKK
jgi:hypothetical protein